VAVGGVRGVAESGYHFAPMEVRWIISAFWLAAWWEYPLLGP
jgi:hypothetical protein